MLLFLKIFNKILLYPCNICRMHRSCKHVSVVKEKKPNKIFILNKAKGGSEKNRKTRTPIAYISSCRKKRRSGPPRAPAARLRTKRGPSQEKIHMNIRPETSYLPGSLVSRRVHECAHVNATRPRGGDISGSVGPGGPTAIVYPRSRERLIKY